MSESREELPRERSHPQPAETTPREEAAMPVRATSGADAAAEIPAARITDWASRRRTTIRVVGGTLLLTIAMSAALEYGGWQRAFADMPTPHAPIPPLSFLRGMWDTTLGAVGVGSGLALAAMVFPSTWRHSWRRVPAAFALGAAAFIGFLSFVTFDFMR